MARKMTFSGAKYRSNGGPGDEYNKTRTTKVTKTTVNESNSKKLEEEATNLIGTNYPGGGKYDKAKAMAKVRYDEAQKNKKRPS